tara:strand:+ start:184 stop:720 length:537 start_codon:yes stop_codon:yes gene_type:complete
MFKCILSFFFSIAILGSFVAQNESAYIVSDKVSEIGNQVDLDLEFFAFSIGVKWQFFEKWQVGPSFGVGFGQVVGVVLEDENYNFYGAEIVRLGLTFKYVNSEKLSFEIEPKIGALAWFGKGGYFGSGTGLLGFSWYYGKKTQVGLRLTGGLSGMGSGNESFFISSSFLILRVPLSKW